MLPLQDKSVATRPRPNLSGFALAHPDSADAGPVRRGGKGRQANLGLPLPDREVEDRGRGLSSRDRVARQGDIWPATRAVAAPGFAHRWKPVRRSPPASPLGPLHPAPADTIL
jgi:hypothetical protein